MALHRVTLAAPELADLALAVEVDELGIAAGLQDRVAQAYGGLTFMDFARQRPARTATSGSTRRCCRRCWWPGARTAAVTPETSTRRSETARRRRAGVVEALPELARWPALPAPRCWPATAPSSPAASMAASTRASAMLELDPRHVAMIECARACGAAANYAGSGGAIVAVCAHGAHHSRVDAQLRGSGASELAARVVADGGRGRRYWKISVVQSPPGRWISCGRAPSVCSWKSTKKSWSSA